MKNHTVQFQGVYVGKSPSLQDKVKEHKGILILS